jgi:hypothetical protein
MKVLDIPSTGKRGTIVAYLSPFGLCHRALVIPKNTITEARSRVRHAFGIFARAWSKVLTQLQREAWDAAGPSVKTAKRLTSGHRTGQLHFQSINTVRAQVGLPTPLLYPPDPVSFGPNPVGQLEITNGEEGVRLFVNLSSAPTEDIMVYGQAPCSAGRRKRRRVAYLGLLPAREAGRAEITALYTARFGEPPVGDKVFIVTRQEKDGWQGFEHETSEIVPPKPSTGRAVATEGVSRLEIGAPLPPPSSQAAATPVLLDSSIMHTECTTVAHRIASPPAQGRPTTAELVIPKPVETAEPERGNWTPRKTWRGRAASQADGEWEIDDGGKTRRMTVCGHARDERSRRRLSRLEIRLTRIRDNLRHAIHSMNGAGLSGAVLLDGDPAKAARAFRVFRVFLGLALGSVSLRSLKRH